MAKYVFSWTGDTDLHETDLSSVFLSGSMIPLNAAIKRVHFRMVIRAHQNTSNPVSYVWLYSENSGSLFSADSIAPSSIEADPVQNMRVRLTFEGDFSEPDGGFSAWFSGLTQIWVTSIGYSDISGGIADLLSLEVFAETEEGWGAYYWDGSKWLECGVYLFVGENPQAQWIKYFDGVSWK
jgi:hypothetical protein